MSLWWTHSKLTREAELDFWEKFHAEREAMERARKKKRKPINARATGRREDKMEHTPMGSLTRTVWNAMKGQADRPWTTKELEMATGINSTAIGSALRCLVERTLAVRSGLPGKYNSGRAGYAYTLLKGMDDDE